MSSWMMVKVLPRSFVLFSTRSPLSSAMTTAKRNNTNVCNFSSVCMSLTGYDHLCRSHYKTKHWYCCCWDKITPEWSERICMRTIKSQNQSVRVSVPGELRLHWQVVNSQEQKHDTQDRDADKETLLTQQWERLLSRKGSNEVTREHIIDNGINLSHDNKKAGVNFLSTKQTHWPSAYHHHHIFSFFFCTFFMTWTLLSFYCVRHNCSGYCLLSFYYLATKRNSSNGAIKSNGSANSQITLFILLLIISDFTLMPDLPVKQLAQ